MAKTGDGMISFCSFLRRVRFFIVKSEVLYIYFMDLG